MANQIRIILFAFLLLHLTCADAFRIKRYRMKFPTRSKEIINELINRYFQTAFIYTNLEIALFKVNSTSPELKTFFRTEAEEKRNLALQLIDYQEFRDSEVQINPPPKSLPMALKSITEILDIAFDLEEKLESDIRQMSRAVWEDDDYELAHHLISHLERQTLKMKKIAEL